jgi:hypothetical protein
MLAPLQCQLRLRLADRALKPQHDLLRCLGLLVKDRFGLTSVTGLLAIVTALSLCEQGGLFVQVACVRERREGGFAVELG